MIEFVFGPDMLFRNAVVGGLLVAVVCGLLGVYVVLRRLVLLGVALPQAGAAGIAAAFWLTSHSHQPQGAHASALVGSVVATFGALALLVGAQRGQRSPVEWSVGALYAVAAAATVLFVALNPTGDLEVTNLLRGEMLAISDSDLVVLAATSLAAVTLFLLFSREILLASFDAEFARTIGHDPSRADAVLFVLLGAAIALGVKETGPLVVFGFLVLPALAALRVAPGLGAAMVISVGVAAMCSVGGFTLAYHADLPTGPTSVALAAGCWLAASAGARLRARWTRRARTTAVSLALALIAAGSNGCAGAFGGAQGASDERAAAQSRGTLPDLADRGPVAVAPFQNRTGSVLRIPGGNPLGEVERAFGRSEGEPWTVTDALAAQAIRELARRGIAVRGFAADRDALPDPPSSPALAASLAREAGLAGPVLFGSLRRFSLSGTGLLLVRLDLALVDPASGDVIWAGVARRPVAVRSALTAQEVVLDAGPAIFAEVFGDR